MLHSHYFSIVRNNEISCCDDLLLLFLKYFVLFPLRLEPAEGMSYFLHGGGLVQLEGIRVIVQLLTKRSMGGVNGEKYYPHILQELSQVR